ncbi:hypothetical protein [Caldithrix abyssi]
MKFLRILFLINTLVVLVFFSLLLTSESESTLSADFTTDVPRPAAFKLLVKQLTAPGEAHHTIEFTYDINGRALTIPYQMQRDDANYRLTLLPAVDSPDLFAWKDVRHQITLKELVDRSTDIQWQLNYRVSGWTARLLNRFFWKPALQKFLDKKINALKQSLAS